MKSLFIQPIFRGLGRNPYNNFVGFLVDLKTPKGHIEIKVQRAELTCDVIK